MQTFVFPGQGSQFKGMGEDLFDDYKELIAIADSVLGYSIKDLCVNDSDNTLGQTQYTQPALFIVNALTYLNISKTNPMVDYFAGHSLGEYSALFAAGAFDFETGVKLVQKRGELMSKATGGGMAAVIGLTDDALSKAIDENKLSTISIANYNSPGQIVIAGPKADIEAAQPVIESAGAKLYIPLRVSGAFHSSYMKSAQDEFARFLNEFTFNDLKVPVISNVTARPYKNSDIKANIISQITNPVKWTESIRYLMGKGEMDFDEIGPGNVLQGLIAKIKSEATPLIINDEDDEAVVSGQKKSKKKQASESDVKPGASSVKKSNSLKEKVVKTKKLKDKIKTISSILPEKLGNENFKKEYNIKYAYVAGGMYMGISSVDMVVKMGQAGMLGFFGTGGLKIDAIENAIKTIQSKLGDIENYGINVTYNSLEEPLIDLIMKYNVRNIEAAAYLQMTPALIKYRLKGITRDENGGVKTANRILAKLSRPEVAAAFMSPAPEHIVTRLLEAKEITSEEAELSKEIPVASDICVEADSGGHTDLGVAYALLPSIIKLKQELVQKYSYAAEIRVGAAGGIGTPEAASAAFVLGADFILTGSINQCTIEAATSDSVKDLLEQMNVQDTEYAPAGDNTFEYGAKVQVLKKGLFFPSKANKLYNLYQQYNSLEEIDSKTKKQLQEKYFKRSFDEIFNECKNYYPSGVIEKAERNPKQKMAIVFKWYFGNATRLALNGVEDQKIDYQINCGPALGAFNQWVKNSEFENWKSRHVDQIGIHLMESTAELLNQRIDYLLQNN